MSGTKAGGMKAAATNKAKYGKEFYSICDNGEILKWVYDDECSKGIIEIDNCFKTREDAEKAVEKLKALRRLRERGLKTRYWMWSGEDEIKICMGLEDGLNSEKFEQIEKDLNSLFMEESEDEN